jgi:hypothetical protein
MWDLFSDDDCKSDDLSHPEYSDTPSQLQLTVSKVAVQGIKSPRSMRMLDHIQGVSICDSD